MLRDVILWTLIIFTLSIPIVRQVIFAMFVGAYKIGKE